MALVREHINEKFAEDTDPVADMNIGMEAKLRRLQSIKERYIQLEDFKDDDIIIYLFKKDYDTWKKLKNSIKVDNIVIWDDNTAAGTSIVKIQAPRIREQTLFKSETSYYDVVSKDIIKFLNSPEIKEKLVVVFNKELESINQLSKLIIATCSRKKLKLGGYYIADRIAERLINIYG